MLEKQAFRVRWGHKRYTSGTRLHSRKYGCTSSIRVKATGNDWLGEENHPLLDKDRKDAVSDYIGGKEWREMRERYPRVFPDVEEDKGEESSEETNDLQEAVFPDDFYGTRLQRSVFPEDTGSRAYIEYDTLPAYEGDVLRKAEDAAELLEQGHIDSNEINFWFRNEDMPDAGFPLKIETNKLHDYSPDDHVLKTSNDDHFTPHCPSLREFSSAQDNLSVGQEIRGKIMGSNVQYGVLVDLGFNIGGLIPMYHDRGAVNSRCFDTMGMEKFGDTFTMEKEILVKVHALRFDKYTSEDYYIYRFPIEVELLEPDVSEFLTKPLPLEEGNKTSPIVIRDPYNFDTWKEMAQSTGRTLPESFLGMDMEDIRYEYEFKRKEQEDNLKDLDIFDAENDDLNKRRGSPDPLWGVKEIAPEVFDEET